jgi:hypothetical protein
MSAESLRTARADDVAPGVAKAPDAAPPLGGFAQQRSFVGHLAGRPPEDRASVVKALSASAGNSAVTALLRAAVTDAGPQGPTRPRLQGPDYDYTTTDAMRDPVQHPDIVKLRKLALETLATSGGDRPVKVVPLNYDPSRLATVKGDFTQAKSVVGRTPEELARILGVESFKDGVRVVALDRSAITEENLNLRGYSQSPAGKSPSLQTPENLAKWPPGLGAPQWNLATDVPAHEIASAQPGTPVRF